MASIDDHIRNLRGAFDDWFNAEATRERRSRELTPGEYDEKRDRYDRQVKEARDAVRDSLETKVLRYGIHYDRHGAALRKFHELASYAKSAFVMTKYPDPDDAGDQSKTLQRVIELVEKSLQTAGLQPRIARDALYHPALWDNVELHSLGCGLGVAIAESQYRPEFNPNVAMEWGWMRGMGRPVIFLVEKDFKLRADVEGTLRVSFDWNDPDGTIPAAIKTALTAVKNSGVL